MRMCAYIYIETYIYIHIYISYMYIRICRPVRAFKFTSEVGGGLLAATPSVSWGAASGISSEAAKAWEHPERSK